MILLHERDDYGEVVNTIDPVVGGDILAGIGVRVHPYVSFFMETKFVIAWKYGFGGVFNLGLRGGF